jgi:hypothetical protein
MANEGRVGVAGGFARLLDARSTPPGLAEDMPDLDTLMSPAIGV